MDDDKNPIGDPKKLAKSIREHAETEIDAKTQDELNTPWSNSSTALSGEDKVFLKELVQKVDSGEIDLHKPSSILNQDIYDNLDGEQQAETDLFINATLFTLRQIYDFYQSEHDNNSDMMINLVQDLRYKKETLEKKMGDVLKI